MTRSSGRNSKINTAPYIPIQSQVIATQKAKATKKSKATQKAMAKILTMDSKPFSQFIPYTLYTYDKNMTWEEHAFKITQMIKNIFETKKTFSMPKNLTMRCDQGKEPACVKFALARNLANIISNQLQIVNANDRDNIHYLVYSFCHILSEEMDLDKNIGYAYTLLMDAYNSQSNIKLAKMEFQSEDILILPSANADEINLLLGKLTEIRDANPSQTEFIFRNMGIDYLLIFIALPPDIINLFATLCDDSPADDTTKSRAYSELAAINDYPSLIIEQNSYKDKEGNTRDTYKFKNDRNKDVPGHALNIVGFEINQAREIIAVYVRGSWGGCDEKKGYIKIPWNLILYYLYSYTSAEAAGITKTRKLKSNKTNKNKKKMKSPKRGTRRRI